MRRGLSIIFLAALLSVSFASATCNLNASMINQDPYPAVPGDYVKVVFQVSGVENPDCGNVLFELIQDYPISLDPSISPTTSITGGTFTSDYSNFLMVPYKVRVNENALDGANPIKVRFSSSGKDTISLTKQFNLEVKQVKTDFEVNVKNYDLLTSTLTLEVLNVGKNDVKAVTLEISQQDEISLKGSRTNIMGNLDSNEYSTADFEATPTGTSFNVKIKYTDTTGTRREQTSLVSFEKGLFDQRNGTQKSKPTWIYVVIGVIVIYLVYRIWIKPKRKK